MFYRLEQEAYKTTPVFINNKLSSLSKMANSNLIEKPRDSLTFFSLKGYLPLNNRKLVLTHFGARPKTVHS